MFSQVNLVPNFSFEDTITCPSGLNQIYNAIGWSNPSNSINSNSDYFNSCNSGFLSTPANAFGYQNTKTGNGYAGFYAFNLAFPNAYEYIETMLADTLKKDTVYCVSLYLSLSEISGYCTNNIGIYFSNNLVTTTTEIILVTPQLINTIVVLSDKDEWMKVEWQYTALGGEKYITIGNFNSTGTSDTVYVGGSVPDGSYYYIDDVFVGKCEDNTTTNITIPNIFTPNNDGINDVFKIASQNITSLNCKIYNRWGILVRELTKINEAWDGLTTSGVKCENGVYYYVVTARGEDGKEYDEKGFVSLVK
ncbi:MAG: gliding motility-associated C-terminal domain-containing protein [Bacteroidota bacterium]